MFESSMNRVIERSKEANHIIIIGAGRTGREVISVLLDRGFKVEAVFDNKEAGEGKNLYGVSICEPYRLEDDGCLYIICVIREETRTLLRSQLNSLGIPDNDITCYYPSRDRPFHRSLDESEYKDEISAMYYERFQRSLDWENPSTYNEIINIEKLKVKDQRRTRYADKFLVREWVAREIGEEYLVTQYGSWTDAQEIDFDALPSSFVLKANNGSVRNIIVKDSSLLDREQAIKELNEALRDNFAYHSFEMHYKDIPPRIVCEEYLEGVADSVYEYDIFCFYGEPKYIWCIKESHKPTCKASFYDPDWNQQQFSYGYPYDETPAPRPNGLDEMLRLSRVLSKDFQHVRVDWYNLPDGRVLFGEMTFSTWGGIMHFVPESYDRHFADLILKAIRKQEGGVS